VSKASKYTTFHLPAFYSLIATCKANHANPQQWLAGTLQKIAGQPINSIEELLPDAAILA
jgi:hypothetical protein